MEENTPIEQEVALDPELLGKVFENLLAAYNPETRETARKQTGSYYTPSAVVDYMVAETLVASLAEKCQPTDGDVEYWHERLHYLLDYEDAYEDANELFEKEEAEGIVRAIAEIKVLDPAVGSGAFPMGMLHKLTLALRRLDPDNTRWEALQKERARAKADAAFETQDQRERDAELLEISETFERYSGDFGRKLYLIQNSIFGVDIQPIACQIAKLRFFISLAIEQEQDKNADNFGIKPLPNLETRFVAADTLIGLRLSEARSLLQDDTVQQLLKEIEAIREKYFLANNRPQKLRYTRQEETCRDQLDQALKAQKKEWVARQQRDINEKIAPIPNPRDRKKLREDELKKYSMREKRFDASLEVAQNVAHWKPYDQNAKADWFDPEYMFGITRGFDVVIGNPPYIQLQKNRGEKARLYQFADYTTFVRTGDIYQLFYEKGCQLLTPQHGLLCYITSDSWLNTEYGKATRRYFVEQHTPLRLLEIGEGTFENAIVNTNILIARHGKSNAIGKAVNMNRLLNKNLPPAESLWGVFRPQGEMPWIALSATEQPIMDKMETAGTSLKEWDVSIYRGLTIGYNKAFIIDGATREALIAKDPNSDEIIKPVLRRGKDLQRYRAQWAGLWLIDTHNGYDDIPAVNIDGYPAVKSHLDGFYPRLEKRQDKGKTPYNLRNCAYYEDFKKEKLVWLDLTEKGRFSYDEKEMFLVNTATMMTGKSLKYLCAVLNSNLIAWFMKNMAPTGMGMHPRWKKNTVEIIPIPEISALKQCPFIQLVDSILVAKDADPDADITEQECEIDCLVYALYGLTEEEIAAVEDKA